jgi:hypothetical protein
VKTRKSPFAFYVTNLVLVVAVLLQAALAFSETPCISPHGLQCPAPPAGCTATPYADVPPKCCYMANSRRCCQMDRMKRNYVGTCPGMPTNCSDCNGTVVTLEYAECITAGSGEGYCE